jgi:hypothetical protein
MFALDEFITFALHDRDRYVDRGEIESVAC